MAWQQLFFLWLAGAAMHAMLPGTHEQPMLRHHEMQL
jgi:hypothetical protein